MGVLGVMVLSTGAQRALRTAILPAQYRGRTVRIASVPYSRDGSKQSIVAQGLKDDFRQAFDDMSIRNDQVRELVDAMEPLCAEFQAFRRIPDYLKHDVCTILGLKDISDEELAAGMKVMLQHSGGQPSEGVTAATELLQSTAMPSRERELEQRERWMWQQMQQLLERERAMIQQERRMFLEREQALHAQLSALHQLLAAQQAPQALPAAAPHPAVAASPTPAETPEGDAGAAAPPSAYTAAAKPPPPRVAAIMDLLNEELANAAAHQAHGTFDEADASSVSEAVRQALDSTPGLAPRPPPTAQPIESGPTAADQVMHAMNIVASGADVLADLDLSMPARGESAPAAPAGGLEAPPAAAAAPAPAPHGNGASASAAGGEKAIETVLAPPDGPPPVLQVGADDIYWVGTLHARLDDAGFYCGDDDVEDIFFGSGTQSAVLTFQACEGIQETGVADDATWAKLGMPIPPAKAPSAPTAAASAAPVSPPPTNGTPKSFGGLFDGISGSASAPQTQAEAPTRAPAPSSSSPATHSGQEGVDYFTKWPVLLEGDGGRAVHSMQVLLERAGYYCDEDEVTWWMFGSTSLAALRTFQSCNGLPESGVCDERTWLALMPSGAKPEDIGNIESGHSDDEDLTATSPGRVWLLGEQRWADDSRLSS